MGVESFPNPQESFNFENGALPAYDTPKMIIRALCYGDDGYTNQDLRVGKDGMFYNDAGDQFERAVGAVDEFRFKRSGEFLEICSQLKDADPGRSEGSIEALAWMKLQDRHRAERLAQRKVKKTSAKTKKIQ